MEDVKPSWFLSKPKAVLELVQLLRVAIIRPNPDSKLLPFVLIVNQQWYL